MCYREAKKKGKMPSVGYFQLVNSRFIVNHFGSLESEPPDCLTHSFATVPFCHLEGQGNDGGGGPVRPRTWCRLASHAARVQHDDEHVRGVRA